jgi:amidohydrolase
MKSRMCVVLIGMLTAAGAPAAAQKRPQNPLVARVSALYPELEPLYFDLHEHPELSQHEEKTSAKMAEHLKALGFEVTTNVGGYGVVGVLKNGPGPTLMIRTELDALPVLEETGLPYASHVVTKDDSGATVPVMHACGHDVHMTAWVGTATLLSGMRSRWRGTLVMIAQPDEEKDSGARAMLKDGLFTRFPRPDHAIAIHDSADLPAGTIGYCPGYALANVDSVDITVYGRGGHGAYPYKTVDPIVIAARIVVALQTIVSREINPLDPAVVTVGSIHGGTKHNIIPDEVHMQLTVRSYKDGVRKHLLDAIARIARAEAAAAGAPKEPQVVVGAGDSATYNDPALTRRIAGALQKFFGNDRVVQAPPVMAAEDFSEYGRAGVPSCIFWVGAVDPGKWAEAQKTGAPLPPLHSSHFAPDREPTIKTAIEAEVTAALELLSKTGAGGGGR